jgi:hypothetical protein
MANNSSLAEHRTTLLGYFLLTAMSMAIFIVVNVIFSDMEVVVDRVDYPSYCVGNVVNTDLKKLTYLDENCEYSNFDKKFNIESEFVELLPIFRSLVLINSEIKAKEQLLSTVQKDIDRLLSRFNISLKEEIYKLDKKSFDYEKIKSKFEELNRKELENIEFIKTLNTRVENILEKNSDKIEKLKIDYQIAIESYNSEYRLFRFKLFLLESAFILPLFLLILKVYFRLKAKDSQNTVIFSFILGSIAFLFIESVFGFIIHVLPQDIAEIIESLAKDFLFFRYILYYVSLLFVVLIFVISVYFIQKMIFSKDAVTFRRLKDSLCPNCGFKIDRDDIFCSNCSYEIRIECEECKEIKFKDMKFCSKCGK